MKFHKKNLITEITVDEIKTHKIWYNSKLTASVDLTRFTRAKNGKDATLVITTNINAWHDETYYLSGGSDCVTEAKIITLDKFEKSIYLEELDSCNILSVENLESLITIKDKKLRNKFIRGLNPYHPINKFCLNALELAVPGFSYGLNTFNDHFVNCPTFFNAYSHIDKTKVLLEEIKPYLDFFLAYEIKKHSVFDCFEAFDYKYLWNTQQNES